MKFEGNGLWFNRYGGVDEIRQLYKVLKEKKYDIVDHLVEKGMDYSDTNDFRDKKDLCLEIVNHDLEYVNKSDVLVELANSPSYVTAMEMLIAKNIGKKLYYWKRNLFLHHGQLTFQTLS